MNALMEGKEGEELAGEGKESREAVLRVLGRLKGIWVSRAETGDPAAAAIVLGICKQRAALLGLTRGGGAALRVAASAGDGEEAGGKEVKVVVEYVNDWREVLRRRV